MPGPTVLTAPMWPLDLFLSVLLRYQLYRKELTHRDIRAIPLIFLQSAPTEQAIRSLCSSLPLAFKSVGVIAHGGDMNSMLCGELTIEQLLVLEEMLFDW